MALVKLSDTIRFSKKVRPVCLRQPNDDEKLVGKMGIITGWGSLNLTSNTEEELKEADVRVVTNEECRKNYSTVDIPVTETMICGAILGQEVSNLLLLH